MKRIIYNQEVKMGRDTFKYRKMYQATHPIDGTGWVIEVNDFDECREGEVCFMPTDNFVLGYYETPNPMCPSGIRAKFDIYTESDLNKI